MELPRHICTLAVGLAIWRAPLPLPLQIILSAFLPRVARLVANCVYTYRDRPPAPDMALPQRRGWGVDFVAHRGGMMSVDKEGMDAPTEGFVAENSLAAFRRACNHGAKYVETDVQVTKDGKVVVFHDPTTKRLLVGEDRNLEEMDLEEVRARAYKGVVEDKECVQCAPTLREALVEWKGLGCKVYLEMKLIKRWKDMVDETMRHLQEEEFREWALENVFIISFDAKVCYRVGQYRTGGKLHVQDKGEAGMDLMVMLLMRGSTLSKFLGYPPAKPVSWGCIFEKGELKRACVKALDTYLLNRVQMWKCLRAFVGVHAVGPARDFCPLSTLRSMQEEGYYVYTWTWTAPNLEEAERWVSEEHISCAINDVTVFQKHQ